MHAVVGIGRIQCPGLVARTDKTRIIVDKQDAFLLCERFKTLVQRCDFVGTSGNLLAPSERCRRKSGGEYRSYAVGLSEFDELRYIVDSHILDIWMGVFSHIVGGGIDDHDARTQIDYIFTETRQELIGGLSRDSASDIAVLFEKVGSETGPVVCNRVAQEHNLSFGRRKCLYFGVAVVVAAEV